MTRYGKFTSQLAAGVAALFFAGQAQAIVVGGMVTSGSGSFVELDPSSTFTVGNDTFQNTNLYAFNEGQNILLGSDLFVNEGASPIAAGTVVASHYVFFDPAGSSSQEGYVDFDSNILGVATSTSLLAASDFLINNNVTYLNPGLRGLESGDSVSFTGMRLFVDWTASTPGDYVRVFTAVSPGAQVPLPASAPLLIAGFGALAALRRRRRAAG